MTRLVSVGNVIVDLTVAIAELPQPGGDVVGTSRGSRPGGSVNTMVAASRQGLTTAYGGAHGTGPFGDQVRAVLAAEGIEVLGEPHPDLDTGFDVALTDATGERTFITVFGAEAHLDRAALDLIPLAPGDYLHVSGYGLLATTNGAPLTEWVTSVSPEVATVFLDPGPLVGQIPAEFWAPVLARADWVSLNRREAAEVSGETKAHEAVVALGAHGVIVRTGAEGCVVGYEGVVTEVPGFPTRVVDTNGAGDAHAGAFLAALARGATPVEAARVANACAAIAVSREGPATAPTLAEVTEFIRR